MKKRLLLMIFGIILISMRSQAQIAAWDFSGNNTAVATFAATTWNANLSSTTSVKNITRGAGAAASSANNSFRTAGFKNEGISTANTDYFQVTLTAATGYKVSLSTIDAKFGGTATFYASPGVTSQFAYSLDGSTFTLIGSAVQSTSLTMTQISLSGISALQNVASGTTIYLRYYASGQTTTGGWGFLSASTAGTNGLAIGGSVTSSSLTPPALTAAAGATVDGAFDVSFTDDASWRGAVSGITVNGTSLASAAYSTGTSGKITLTPNQSTLLQSSGSKTIVVSATGYSNATVSQTIGVGAVSSSTSTATISAALTLNGTKTVTATAKDQYSNLVSGYTFNVLPTVTNSTATTTESYTVNGTSYTSTPGSAAALASATNSSGVATFDVTIPATVDGADGISVQVKLNDGTTNVGSAFSYTAPTTPAASISSSGLSEITLNGAQVSVTLSNTAFTDGTLSSANFTLNNAPTGTSVNSVAYNSATSATVTLTFNGTDFDANVTNFSVTVAGSELTTGSPVTSNTLTITSVTETAPTVTTTAISGTSSSGASSGGNVSSDGGGTASAVVTARGVCWSSTLGAETASGSHTTDGTGTGSFTSTLSDLLPNTTYYLKAYATNGVGTAYGSEISFTTSALSAPTANYATEFSTTGFTANWGAVTGATSYRLDVATNPAFDTTVTMLSENFGLMTSGSIGSPSSTNIAASLDSYTQVTGWTGVSIYSAGGVAKFGASSTLGYIVTPTVDLSAGATLKFDLQTYGSDAKVVQVFLSTDGGSTFPTQIGSDITPTSSMVTQTLTVSGASATSKIKISASNASSNRFYLDNISLSKANSYTISGYSDLTVNGTSQSVSGLSPNTKYYYRTRAYSATSTSANSSVISLTTPNLITAPTVTTGTDVPVTVSGSTGISGITFGSVTNGGNLAVSRFSDAPANPSGITNSNTSWYRWIIEPPAGFAFTNYTVTFKRTDINGIAISGAQQIPADGDNTSVILYKRSTPGSGAFTNVGALTYHQNGTPSDISDDYLVSQPLTSFSEFVLGSDQYELPVELSTLSAKVSTRSVRLDWTTATEVNSYKFVVERSVSGANNWSALGEVRASNYSNAPKSYGFDDKNLNSGKYSYRLKMVDNDGTYEYSKITAEATIGVPVEFSMSQNYPNPFNPTTKITYALPVNSHVTLELYAITGQKVATILNSNVEAGYYDVPVNMSGYNLSSGVYMYRFSGKELSSGKQFTSVKKMMFLK